MGDVKISSLELENVKRVRAVELSPTPDGLTVIGGRNAQGKTSVLDAIAWALGGNKMKPEAPNRDGAATPARLRVELSNGLVVERRGKNGSLHVTDASGMRGGQQLLDAFVGQLALDLPRFLNATDKGRADMLLETLGVDAELAAIDRDIKAAFDERTAVGRDADRRRKAAEGMPSYPEAPTEPVDVADLTERLQAALRTNAENDRRRKEVEWSEAEADRVRQALLDTERRIEALMAERDAQAERCEQMLADLKEKRAAVAGLRDADVSDLEAEIRGAQAMNEWVRANRERAAMVAEAEALEAERAGLTERIESLRADRLALLNRAGMPLPGLSVEGGLLSYSGHAWSDMSGAEQLRVATAVARLTKPGCGFVLVDKLEQLDARQLAEFAEWAVGEGLQVIGTRVATDDTCTVVIEDGRIVGQDLPDAKPEDPRGTPIGWDGPEAKAWGGGEF